MTKRITISMPDETHERIEALIQSGDYASASEVLRHGLRLIERAEAEERRREEEHEARLRAIRDDLACRAEGPFLGFDDMTGFLDEARKRRRDARSSRAS